MYIVDIFSKCVQTQRLYSNDSAKKVNRLNDVEFAEMMTFESEFVHFKTIFDFYTMMNNVVNLSLKDHKMLDIKRKKWARLRFRVFTLLLRYFYNESSLHKLYEREIANYIKRSPQTARECYTYIGAILQYIFKEINFCGYSSVTSSPKPRKEIFL